VPNFPSRSPREIDPVVHLAEGHQRIGTLLGQADLRLAAVLFEHMGLEQQILPPLAERYIFTPNGW
jgi:hypothetical protein